MSLNYLIQEDSQLLVTRFSGAANSHDLIDWLVPFRKLAATWPELNVLALLLDIETTSVRLQEARQLAETAADILFREGTRANICLVADTDILFGMARVFSSQFNFGGHGSAMAVRDMTEAEQWLGLDAELVAQLPASPPTIA